MRSLHEPHVDDLADWVGEEWRLAAACRDYDPEWWFALPGSAQRVWALNICQTECPVATNCLQEALDNGLEGIWGGTTEDDRRQVKQPDRRTRTGPRSQHYERIVELAARGDTDQQIADACGLAVNSVKKMRERHHIPSGRSRREALAQTDWLPTDDQVLLRMLAQRHTFREIGAVLGRSASAVRRRRDKLQEVPV